MATAVAPRQEPISTSTARLSIPEAWHLLSLDAPTVAALWAWFFARSMRIDLPWHAPLLLALGTWLIYVADRILDGYRSARPAELQARHHFHERHRKAFLGAAIVAGTALLWLISTRMATSARREDTVLFLIALLYLCLVHRPSGGARHWLPKELAVGIVFAAATAVPTWSRLGAGRITLLPAIALFAALCWLNCVAIERWENPTILSGLSATHITTRWVAAHFRPVCLGLATLAAALAALTALSLHRTTPIYLAALTSALAFIQIDRHRQRFSAMQLRIAADAILLTPVVFLPFFHR